MSPYASGRHEFGQNFLSDRRLIDQIVAIVARTDGPIVEIGPGAGALTVPMSALGRTITAVEIDGAHVTRLRRRVPPRTSVIHGDFLRHRLPEEPHIVVGNLPFHQTTAILRRLLHADNWHAAVLITQWEVARRRAGVGGATMMTAQWWPWYEFRLVRRVPASAFTPRPTVDAGLFTVDRRPEPLVEIGRRRAYQSMVHSVFTGRGRGVPQIVSRLTGGGAPAVHRWREIHGIDMRHLPRDLQPLAWADLFDALPSGTERRPRGPHRDGRR
ncbi:23S ribosomal RNA methyltransferase Erm [Gordonia soli]|uniref:Putative rRNA adenine N-6-methyltransferase n=1 Tax=Gordonia soli NBRC 108243 TaxID=1223545 RepID=M0QIS1_9ACTN|nr:23S ribosomal RNA methyltransferase Erm [Gordonia soli]GAC68339.1 putative rRNA adenine N-6-methyltransferase [Gordonia soli NBRC 108243]